MVELSSCITAGSERVARSASVQSRLSYRTSFGIDAGVRKFRYDRTRLAAGIVHLGLGAFARAHLCDFTEDVLEQDFGPWVSSASACAGPISVIGLPRKTAYTSPFAVSRPVQRRA